VGPLPDAVQDYIVLTAGVGARAKEPAIAAEFVRSLNGPSTAPVIKAKGLEPGA
jgi:hypothetical protein